MKIFSLSSLITITFNPQQVGIIIMLTFNSCTLSCAVATMCDHGMQKSLIYCIKTLWHKQNINRWSCSANVFSISLHVSFTFSCRGYSETTIQIETAMLMQSGFLPFYLSWKESSCHYKSILCLKNRFKKAGKNKFYFLMHKNEFCVSFRFHVFALMWNTNSLLVQTFRRKYGSMDYKLHTF